MAPLAVFLKIARGKKGNHLREVVIAAYTNDKPDIFAYIRLLQGSENGDPRRIAEGHHPQPSLRRQVSTACQKGQGIRYCMAVRRAYPHRPKPRHLRHQHRKPGTCQSMCQGNQTRLVFTLGHNARHQHNACRHHAFAGQVKVADACASMHGGRFRRPASGDTCASMHGVGNRGAARRWGDGLPMAGRGRGVYVHQHQQCLINAPRWPIPHSKHQENRQPRPRNNAITQRQACFSSAMMGAGRQNILLDERGLLCRVGLLRISFDPPQAPPVLRSVQHAHDQHPVRARQVKDQDVVKVFDVPLAHTHQCGMP